MGRSGESSGLVPEEYENSECLVVTEEKGPVVGCKYGRSCQEPRDWLHKAGMVRVGQCK